MVELSTLSHDILEYCIKGLKYQGDDLYSFKGETYKLTKTLEEGKQTVYLFFSNDKNMKVGTSTSTGIVKYDCFNDTYLSYSEEDKKALRVLFQHHYYETRRKIKRQQERKKNERTVECTYCGKEFKSHKLRATFCSKECRILYNREIRKKEPQVHQCRECGKTFKTFKYQLFCSAECRIHYHSKRLWQNIKEKRGELKKTCKHCGKEFIAKTDQFKYCSDRCRIKHNSTKQKVKSQIAKQSSIIEKMKSVLENKKTLLEQIKNSIIKL